MMTWLTKLLTFFPDSWQDRLLARIIASNRWNEVPTFQMLFRSFELLGADHEDIIEIFTLSSDLGLNFYVNCRQIAHRRRDHAVQLEHDPIQARKEYQKALILYFLADWVSFDEKSIRENYLDLLAVSHYIDSLASISTEKIYFPWTIGTITARFRYPKVPSFLLAIPLVIVVQGNDTVKEAMLFIEDELLKEGFAVLNVDQPGWGESRLSGNFYHSIQDARLLGDKIFAFIQQHPFINPEKVAIFGFSGGGTWAAMITASEPRIHAMISVGGAIYNLEKTIRYLPANQKRQVIKHWGCSKVEIRNLAPELDFRKILPQIRIPCLIIHGEQDTLVPVHDIQTAVKLISGPVTLEIVPGGDHMCSTTISTVQIPYIFQWIHRIFR